MNQTTEKGLEFNGRLPLSVQTRVEIPSAQELVQINTGNEQLLKTVTLLDEKVDVDENDEILQELKRQDIKINMVLDMLSTLLIQNNAIPPSFEITLTDSWIRIKDTDAEYVEGDCCVKLYINAAIPRPLVLYGSLKRDIDASYVQVHFQGMSPSLVNAFDKYIFRFHRRLVASSRTA